jgi:uncharacterized protein YdcH (DUF465 family)
MIMSLVRGAVGDPPERRMLALNHPTEQVSPTASAWQAHKGDTALMENTQEELKAHLMKADEEFRLLADQHAQYHKQLEALEAKPRLTPEEELEEHRLKKLKLRLKDQMNGIISRYRAQNVA